MRYYLAGPMTHIPQHNFPAFFRWAKLLRLAGYDIVSPAELDVGEVREVALASEDGEWCHEQPWSEFLARDVRIVAEDVDAVLCMPGWARSRGVRLETFVAYLTGKPVYTVRQVGLHCPLIHKRRVRLWRLAISWIFGR